MDTTEKPKAWLPGRVRNPAYDVWRKAQKEAAKAPNTDLAKMLAEGMNRETLEEFIAMGGPRDGDTLSLKCVKLARNTAFVYCAEGEGTVGVKVKRGMGPKLLKKTINVRKEGETYVHIP